MAHSLSIVGSETHGCVTVAAIGNQRAAVVASSAEVAAEPARDGRKRLHHIGSCGDPVSCPLCVRLLCVSRDQLAPVELHEKTALNFLGTSANASQKAKKISGALRAAKKNEKW